MSGARPNENLDELAGGAQAVGPGALNLLDTSVGGTYEVVARMRPARNGVELYLAEMTIEGVKQQVVIKTIPDISAEVDDETFNFERESFERERTLLQHLRHPNIVSLIDHGTDRDASGRAYSYMVTNRIKGVTFDKVTFPSADGRFFEILEQICSALSYAHAHDVVHSDIKGSNLIWDRDRGIVVLLDFGAARTKQMSGERVRATAATRAYAPPEAIRFGALAPTADVYSLAKVVYALLTGTSPNEFHLRPITSLPRPLADRADAAAILGVLRKATDEDPAKRPQTVIDFYQELRQAVRATEGSKPMSREGQQPEIFIPLTRSARQKSDETPATRRARPSTSRKRIVTTAALAAAMTAISVLTNFCVGSLRSPKEGGPGRGTVVGERGGCRGFTTTDVNLRPGPNTDSPPVGLAEVGSRVCILTKRGLWYEVEVVEHGRDKKDPDSSDRGWLRISYVRFE